MKRIHSHATAFRHLVYLRMYNSDRLRASTVNHDCVKVKIT